MSQGATEPCAGCTGHEDLAVRRPRLRRQTRSGRHLLRSGVVFALSILLATMLSTGVLATGVRADPTARRQTTERGDRVVKAFPSGVHTGTARAALARDLLATAVEEAGSARSLGADTEYLDLVVEYTGGPVDLEALLSTESLEQAAADVTGGSALTTVTSDGSAVTVSGTLATMGVLTLDLGLLTAADRTWFVDLLGRAYPVMVDAYGPPAQPLTVRVWKNSFLPYAGLYTPTGNFLLVRELSADAVIHELLHAFRDDVMSTVPVYEEGIVRAAEVLVLDRLAIASWDSGHSYTYDRMYSAHNQDTVLSAYGTIIAGYAPMYLLRYQVAGMAWGKAELAQPGFLRDFNSRYVAAALADALVRGDGTAQRALFAGMAGTIEGAAPGAWVVLQEALTPTGAAGLQLHADVTDDALTVRLYYRDANGTEVAAPGTLEISVTPHGSTSPRVYSATTSGLGMTTLPLGTAAPARLDIRVTAQTGYGTAVRSFQAYGGVGSGLFGIITGDAHPTTGTITATNGAGGATAVYAVSLSDGAFHIPELADYQGVVELSVVFEGDPGVYTASIVKGSGATYVRLTDLVKAADTTGGIDQGGGPTTDPRLHPSPTGGPAPAANSQAQAAIDAARARQADIGRPWDGTNPAGR